MIGKQVKDTARRAFCVAVVMLCGLGSAAFAQQIPNEDELLATLTAPSSTWDQKQNACRGLKRMGTNKSIPALAALLNDEKLSHMARFALESNPSDQAGAVLRDAVGTTTGTQRMGVVITLGARRDAKATSLIAPLLKDADVNTARAAAGALGSIATTKSLEILVNFLPDASEALQPAVYEGILKACENMTKDGKGKRTVKTLEGIIESDAPLYARMGAFYRLAYAQPKKTVDRVLDAIAGDNVTYRDLAAQIVSETKGEDATEDYADALAGLPAEGQVALLRGLGNRKDSEARDAVLAATKSSDKSVQLAAISALGKIGTADDVAPLTALISNADADVAGAARGALSGLMSEGVDAAIAAEVADATPAVKAQLIELLTARMATEALPLGVKNVGDASLEVRIAALHTLSTLGGKAELPVLIESLKKATDSTERTEAASALSLICSLHGDEALPVVVESMAGATPETRVVLLRALGEINNTKALEAVVAAIGDGDESVRGEAVRVLSNWKSVEAAPHLLKLASSENASWRNLAMNGYVRLATSEGDLGAKIKMLTTAMGMAKRQEEKWLVLGAWGKVPAKEALDAVRPHLNDATVRNEAALAIISSATAYGKTSPEAKAQALEALNNVISKCDDASVKERAQQAIATLG